MKSKQLYEFFTKKKKKATLKSVCVCAHACKWGLDMDDKEIEWSYTYTDKNMWRSPTGFVRM